VDWPSLQGNLASPDVDPKCPDGESGRIDWSALRPSEVRARGLGGRGCGRFEERPGSVDIDGTEDDGSILQQSRDARNFIEGQAHTQHQSWICRVVQHVDAPSSTAIRPPPAYRSASQGVHRKWGDLTHF
jgi:hypothetical protein